MSSQNPLRPPEVLLPWAGVWAKWIADAIDVGLSPSERADPVIVAAADGLTQRTIERATAGETATEKAAARLVSHVATLLRYPHWAPLHGESQEDCERMLHAVFGRFERWSACSSLNANPSGAVTRAALRLVLVEVALLLGWLSRGHAPAPVSFRPWKAKEGFGRVIRDLYLGFQPKLKREEVIERLKISSPSVWDRLLQGELPVAVGVLPPIKRTRVKRDL